MRYQINQDSHKFAYIQLYEQLRQDIVKGILPYGSKLPSKRLLAEETEVSVITVEHTYSILCEEGYIESRERSGYFVVYRENDFFSNMARSNRIKVHPEQIIIGSGAEYFYSLIVQFLGGRRKFALENPSYNKIQQVYEANGVICDMLELGQDGIKSKELEETDATVLHITPFHSFPSGVTASVSKRHEYLRWAEKRNGYIIEDNYDSELTVSKKNEDTVFSLSDKGKVIYLNTFSHTIAPSMRIGYMVLPEQKVEEFHEKLGFYSCSVPVFEQYVLAELINSGDFERHINRVRRARRKAK